MSIMKKILVIRFSSMGDIVLTTPVMRWIKKQWNAEVHFLTNDNFTGLLQDNPYIDKIIGCGASTIDCAHKLRLENYDLIIDLHKSLKSRVIKLLLFKKSITFDKLNILKWIFVNFKKDLLPATHLVDRYAQSLSQVGIKNDGLGLDFFYPAQQLPIELPNQYEVLVLGAAHGTKRIPTTLAEKIIKKAIVPIVLIGGKDVITEGKQLESSCGNEIINLIGQLSINQSAEVINRSTHVHTGDTGMMHIAAALQKEITVYWGNTTPKLGMYPYYGSTQPNIAINKEVDLPCRPCSKLGHAQCPKGHFKCMLDIDV